ncbi:M28 family peptidase [Flavobacterium algicola]|uniref:M28 family peptidase n=1 Tax=Flavobacterium algicola TaxID=556529 RepID=UPI001EFE40EB|nr:M28 family peptidase [Flavobacterium algicola]MCG9791814.1 M28 family peptidase [Flavobacterium algicola]
MIKKFSSLISVLILSIVLGIMYYSIMPRTGSETKVPLVEFSSQRAFKQVQAISKQPHFVGSENHEIVAQYLQQELQQLGLKVSLQEGYTLTDWGNLVYSKNIIARIKGTNSNKALLLLTHYDSAPHSASFGASDAGSGVATVLESLRAFLHSKKAHKNDIILLFTDAEELGLNGAALFVTKHRWAKEIGLALNFEARGTSGPSYMLMETNKGNAGLVNEFANANVPFPVSNSLMYSIYKMLPNDTDLTVFRKHGEIQGFNFAFIDGHYNYHTAQDDSQHLDINSLAHQGSYLLPLLHYFSNANLNATNSLQDDVYFSLPFSFIHYPFDWVQPMLFVAIGLTIILVFFGKVKHILNFRSLLRGFLPLLASLLLSSTIAYFGWKALLSFYPQYNDLLNGFTYNGHDYIIAFVSLTLAICMLFYTLFSNSKSTVSNWIAPLILWIIINAGIAFYLQGAGFLILPVFFGLFGLSYYIISQQNNRWLNLIMCLPAVLIIIPFIYMFPVGLGLKMLVGSSVLTVLLFGLLLPIFESFSRKGIWSILFLIISITFFVKAHFQSGYEKGMAKSNSLIYLYDVDAKKASWVTYDKNLDDWTRGYLGNNPKETHLQDEIPLFSKYNSIFTYATETAIRKIPTPKVLFLKDSLTDNLHYYKIKINPSRKVNRYDIYADEKMEFYNFKANGVSQLEETTNKMSRNGKKILSYYVVNNQPLELEFTINRSTVFDMCLLESSFDLLKNPLFAVQPRADWMMPTPFILNDAVCIKQIIKPSPIAIEIPSTNDDSIINTSKKNQIIQTSQP